MLRYLVIFYIILYYIIHIANQLLMVVMSAVGVGLAFNPATNGINTGLFKGYTWLFSGIVSQLLK
jgi:hypothetical protein